MIDQLLQEQAATPGNIRAVLVTLVTEHKEPLAEVFYDTMLEDEHASQFLSLESVQQRLKPGLSRWLDRLFCHSSTEELKATLAMQRQVGEVHARAGVPVQLVARGMRLLKREISKLLVDSTLARNELAQAILYADRLIDIAFEEMSSAFAYSHESEVRTDEGFRLFAAGHNLSLEREKQIAALLDWENRLFRALATDMPLDDAATLTNSAFGLWFHHKAPLIFNDTHELPMIEDFLRRIDDNVMPQLTQTNRASLQSSEMRTLVRNVMSEVEQIRYLVGAMFERLTDLEVGRDALTQVFNRRFLPTILKREVELNRRHAQPFAVLMVDIDWFKRVNDEYGHDSGDRVLQSVAGLLLNQVRASDFVFRYGGEEFLIVLAEVDTARAQHIAEQIRQCIAATRIPLSDERTLQVTLSIGIAASDSHPDYQRMIDRADAALYAAKHAGRNRCSLSG